MTTTTRKDESLLQTGRCAMDCLTEFSAAIQVDYDRLDELKDERDDFDGNAEAWAAANPADAAELAELLDDANCNGEQCESEDDARQMIEDDPLSIEVRSDWTMYGETLTADNFCILLSTGGPATRIIGDLEGGEPSRPRLEVQDWGTPWTEHITTGAENEALEVYCRCFYFGE